MSEIRFEVGDAAEIRFCVSPLWETVRSLYAVADPGRHVAHLPWVRWVRSQTEHPRIVLLQDLARPRAWLPDFLTPAPSSPLVTLEEELAVVLATPADVVRSDLLATTARLPLAAPVVSALDEPKALLRKVADEIRAWHRFAIAPHWTRMQALLEADIAYRSRELAEGGVRRLFNTLHPSVRWAGDRIISTDRWETDLDLRGRGLPLMPSLFVDRRVLWSIRADSPPVAVYPARAAATLWETQPHTSKGLGAVVGVTRARLLSLIVHPATTTELARRLGVSAPAVSQHLHVLRAAGLAARSSHGHAVLYVITAAGHTLLEAASAQPSARRS